MNTDNDILIEHQKESTEARLVEIDEEIKALETEKRAKADALADYTRGSLSAEVKSRILSALPEADSGDFRKLHAILDGVKNLTAGKMRRPADPWESILEEAHRPDGIHLPEKFGPELSKITMRPGLPVFVGGYAGTGKSTFLLNLVRDAIVHKRKSVFFTCEMTAGQLWTRLAGIDVFLNSRKSKSIYNLFQDVRDGDLFLREMIHQFSPYLHVIDSAGWTASEIISAYERHCHEYGEPLQVYIDYLQRVRPEPQAEGQERRLQVVETVELLTEAAKRNGNSWIIAAQTNREGQKNEIPDLSNFQESAAIEQNAGLAITINQAERNGELNALHVWVCKNRFGRTLRKTVHIDMKTGAIDGAAPGV